MHWLVDWLYGQQLWLHRCDSYPFPTGNMHGHRISYKKRKTSTIAETVYQSCTGVGQTVKFPFVHCKKYIAANSADLPVVIFKAE